MAVALLTKAQAELAKAGQEGGPTLREMRDTVEFAMKLLVQLPKLRPSSLDDDSGIDALKAAMTDPAGVAERLQLNKEFRGALIALGWLAPPEKVPHRPTKAQQEERAAYAARKAQAPDEDDETGDSALKRMLAKAGEQ